MIAGYGLPDVYQTVADQLGTTRKVAKIACLAIQYGAQPKRLESAGIPFFDAKKIFEYHKDTYSQYWRWSDECLERLKADGIFKVSGDGWALRFDGNDSGNALLTARNFPIQATAAAILRRVVLEAAKQDVEVVGPLHDSILAQVPAAQAKERAEALCEIMRAASRQFLNGNEVRVAFHVYEERFEDKDGAQNWQRISEILSRY
jgi:DNA polymerase I-like protein with 3'-5' exonuclease and polymerase domains